MTTTDRQGLLEDLAMYGYPLMRTARHSEPEAVLEKLLRQHEGRLLEGFATVLLTALRRKANLRWERQSWHPEAEFGSAGARRFVRLVAVSYLLYRLFGVEKSLQDRALQLLNKSKEGNQTLKELEEEFARGDSVAMHGVRLSTDRLKNTFRTYYASAQNRPDEEDDTTRALTFELLLSELFTPRQKELLRKRLEHSQMTNSEKTYFYRTVSKRLKAVADEGVHAFARRLVGK